MLRPQARYIWLPEWRFVVRCTSGMWKDRVFLFVMGTFRFLRRHRMSGIGLGKRVERALQRPSAFFVVRGWKRLKEPNGRSQLSHAYDTAEFYCGRIERCTPFDGSSVGIQGRTDTLVVAARPRRFIGQQENARVAEFARSALAGQRRDISTRSSVVREAWYFSIAGLPFL